MPMERCVFPRLKFATASHNVGITLMKWIVGSEQRDVNIVVLTASGASQRSSSVTASPTVWMELMN